MKTQIIIVMLLALAILGCGKENGLGLEIADLAQKQLSKPAAIKSPPKNWSVVGVIVLKDGQPLQGVDVKFSRSISGQSHVYQWEGEASGYPSGQISETDVYGWCEVSITSDPKRSIYSGATGYYSARVIDPETNVILGDWNSIPLQDGHLRTVFLEIGKPVRFASVEAENDIRETFFRANMDDGPPYLLALSFGSMKLANGEWADIDPPDSFLDRFQQDAVQVIKPSQTEYQEIPSGYYHKETGERAARLCVSKFRWVSDTEVMVKTSYYISNLGGHFSYRLLIYSDGQWITKEILLSLVA